MVAAVTIQILLTLILLVVGFLVAVQRVTSALFRASLLFVIAVGTYLIWSPDDASRIANAVGVGRGADLVSYLWLIVSLGLIAFLYLKIVLLSRVVTQLARAVALGSPMPPMSSAESDRRA